MFGLGGKKEETVSRVGAREKLKQARKAMGHGDGNIKSKKEGKETNPAVSVITILMMAIAVAWLVTENVIQSSGIRFKTGWDDFDHFMFRRSNANGLEYLMVISLRGFVFFLAAGLLPFFAFAWQRALDDANMNVYRTVWGVPIGLALAFYGFVYVVWPIINEVILGFS